MEDEPAKKRGDRTQDPDHQLAMPHQDLGAEPGQRFRLRVCPLGREPVPTADVAPELGTVRDIGPDGLGRDAKQLIPMKRLGS